ncbi:MAG: hypothetical protein WCB01_13405 [Candidatus Cybelea sp.]
MENDRRLPSDEETISPDIAPRKDRPLDPAEAVRLERDKYGEGSINPNREDQEDEHGGTADDIV